MFVTLSKLNNSMSGDLIFDIQHLNLLNFFEIRYL